MNYNYDDFWLQPRELSNIEHRSEIDTSIDCFGIKLDLPIIASPMPDVCNGLMAKSLATLGSLGIIHRFQSIKQQVEEYTICSYEKNDDSFRYIYSNVACSIGVIGDYKLRFENLHCAGCRIFCLDTANGFNIQVEKAIKDLSKYQKGKDRFYLIVGNVATGEGFEYLSSLLCSNNFEDSAIRIGIAGGSVCETKTETGIYKPVLESLTECILLKNKFKNIKLIADGGIRTPADMCKALYVGADFVMCGSIFAGTKESPGNVIHDNGKLVKLYRGAASFSVQQEYKNKNPDYVEGRESFVPYKGRVERVIKRFKNGLQSSMSYMNARNLNQFKMGDILF